MEIETISGTIIVVNVIVFPDKIHVLNNPKAAAEHRPSRVSKVKPPSRSNLLGSRGNRRATLAQTGLKGGKKMNLM